MMNVSFVIYIFLHVCVCKQQLLGGRGGRKRRIEENAGALAVVIGSV